MDFAYKIPDGDRAKHLIKKSKDEEPHEDDSNIPNVLKQIQKMFSGSAGSEDEQALLDAIDPFIEAITNPNVDGTQDPRIQKAIVILHGPGKLSGFLGDLFGGLGGAAGSEAIGLGPEDPAADAGAAAALAPAATDIGEAAAPVAEDVAQSGIGKAMGKGIKYLGINQAVNDIGGPIKDMFGFGGGGNYTVSDPQSDPGVYASVNDEKAFEYLDKVLHTANDRGTIRDDAFLFFGAKDPDVEQLRGQVKASLQAWATTQGPNQLTPDKNAMWWVFFASAAETSNVSLLANILAAVPEEYHTNGGSPEVSGAIGQTDIGSDAAQGGQGESIVPSPAGPSEGMLNTPPPEKPAGPGAGAGAPGGQSAPLIPGALSSVKPDWSFLNFDNVRWSANSVLGDDGAYPSPMQMLYPGAGGQNPMAQDQAGGATPQAQQSDLNPQNAPLEVEGQNPELSQNMQTNLQRSEAMGENQTQDISPATQSPLVQPIVSPESLNTPMYQQPQNTVQTPTQNGLDPSVMNPGANAMMHTMRPNQPVSSIQMEQVSPVADLNETDVYKATPDHEGDYGKGKDMIVMDLGEPEIHTKTSSVSMKEQRDLIDEIAQSPTGLARNFDRINLKDSHYEQEFSHIEPTLRSLFDLNIPLSNSYVLEDEALFF